MVIKSGENCLDNIKVAGWQKLSLIDYPGKMAAVIFLAGCNMRCHYCHNYHILDARQNCLPLSKILDEIRARLDWLDAVVISGGEPTISPVLIPILSELRKLGLLIKLDTNGTCPDVVRQVVKQKLVDYVALDIKASVAKHQEITGIPIQKVLETAQFLRAQKQVSYMFRTTVTPRLNQNDLLEIGQKIIRGAPCWQIQQCRIEGAYSAEKLLKMAGFVKSCTQHIVVSGI